MAEQRARSVGTDQPRGRREAEPPAEEIQRLALRLADARDWAVHGRPALGYAALMQGLLHAERALLSGEPWAATLIQAWRSAIDQYCTEHDPQRED